MANFTYKEFKTVKYELKLPSNAAETHKMLDACYNHFIDVRGEKPKEDQISVEIEPGDMGDMYLVATFDA